MQMQLQENKAKIMELENKLNALVNILKKEGITDIEEVENLANSSDGEKDE